MKPRSQWATPMVCALAALSLPLALSAEPPPAPAKPDPLRRPVTNAALIYWQAFAQMPELPDAESDALAAEWQTIPLEKAKPLVDRFESSLRLLERAAAVSDCDWGLAYRDGFLMMLPHLGKARQLSRAAVLRARVRLADGDAEGATRDLANVLTLAGHIGGDDVLICLLVRFSLEATVTAVAAEHLPKLTGQPMTRVMEALARCQRAGSAEASVRMEGRVVVATITEQLELALKLGGPDKFYEAAAELWAMTDSDGDQPKGPTRVEKIKLFTGGDPQMLLKLIRGCGEAYGKFADFMRLPPAECRAKSDALLEELRTKNVVAAMLLPALERVREQEARMITRRAMLEAAVAVHADGEAALSRFGDAFHPERKPFEFRKLPGGGFELSRPAFRTGEEPIVLRVGASPNPTPMPAPK